MRGAWKFESALVSRGLFGHFGERSGLVASTRNQVQGTADNVHVGYLEKLSRPVFFLFFLDPETGL